MAAPSKHPDDLLIGTLQRFTKQHLIDMGKLIKDGKYENRAELVRAAIDLLIEKESK